MHRLVFHMMVLFIPLTVTLILHMLVVKRNSFSALTIPISKNIFGKNKTWRGFVFVPLVNAFFSAVLAMLLQRNLLEFAVVGSILGLAYILAELPNSYFKRKLNIPPGGRHPHFPLLFLFIDKADSITGVLLVYYLITDLSLAETFVIFCVAMVLHFTVSTLLYRLKIKSSI
ncbi:CDP-archaeol synthase [Flavobacteriaceae bacterium M23B6Z8]